MSALSITHTVFDGGTAHGEADVKTLKVIRTRGIVTTSAVVPCPGWLAELICEQVQEEADALAAEYLSEEAA